MNTSNGIQSAARRINSEKKELQTSRNRFDREVENTRTWWQGEASKAFEKGYEEVGKEINRLYSKIDDVEEGLRRLSAEVQRADEERIRIEAERKRKEAESKKKAQIGYY